MFGTALVTVFLGLSISSMCEAQDLTMVEKTRVSQWRIMQLRSGASDCSARIDGAKIDLIVMLNGSGKVILMAGHPNWKPMSGDFTSPLAIGQAEPQSVKTTGLMTMAITQLDDQQASAALSAKTVHWSLPSGDFTVNIDHFSEMLDALRACKPKL